MTRSISDAWGSLYVRVAAMLIATMVGAPMAFGDAIDNLVTFNAGEPAVADEVNANFDEVATLVGIGFDSNGGFTLTLDGFGEANHVIVNTVTIDVPGPGIVALHWRSYASLNASSFSGIICRIRLGASESHSVGYIPQGLFQINTANNTTLAGTYRQSVGLQTHYVHTGGQATLVFSTSCYSLAASFTGVTSTSLEAVYYKNEL